MNTTHTRTIHDAHMQRLGARVSEVLVYHSEQGEERVLGIHERYRQVCHSYLSTT